MSYPWRTTPHCSEKIKPSPTRILESHKDPKMCPRHYMTMWRFLAEEKCHFSPALSPPYAQCSCMEAQGPKMAACTSQEGTPLSPHLSQRFNEAPSGTNAGIRVMHPFDRTELTLYYSVFAFLCHSVCTAQMIPTHRADGEGNELILPAIQLLVNSGSLTPSR